MDAGSSVVPIAVGLGVANTFTAWSAFTPSLSDIREASTADSAVVGALRHGEFATVVIAGGIAAGASALIGSALPLMVSAVLIVALITLYEYTLTHKPFGTLEERTS